MRINAPIRADPFLDTGQDPATSANLLFDIAHEDDIALQLHSQPADRVHGQDDGGEARLHVLRAPAVHPSIFDLAAERVVGPILQRTLGHRIDVSEKKE